MKHPVDTSTWGEFKVGELFDVHPTKAYKLKNSDLLSVDGEIPVVVNSSYNNGIGGYSKLEPTEQPGVLTFSDTTSGSNTLFYQNQSFIGYAHVQGMYPKNFELTDLTALFMIATLRATIDQRKWDYTNKLNRATVIEMNVKLPLKQGTNPSDYSQDDIDWDYMESFMSRVQDAAKERLANVPEPGKKSKTPVDVSKWGEFKVGDLFDMFPGRRLKKGDFEDGDIPFVMSSSYNNGVVTTLSNPISTNENFLTADIFGNVFYQKELVGYGDDNCGLKLKYRDGRPNEYLFLATMISSISVQASFTNKLRGPWYIEQTIPLPLKPTANSSDYSQEDIDWDYMESFMLQFQTSAKNRLERLTSVQDCDILTV